MDMNSMSWDLIMPVFMVTDKISRKEVQAIKPYSMALSKNQKKGIIKRKLISTTLAFPYSLHGESKLN